MHADILPPITTPLTIRLRAPMLILVLAATAVPVEFRSWNAEPMNFGFGFLDTLANVLGYIPVGMVLAECGVKRAILWAALLTFGAEMSQLVMLHRTPSAADMLSNFAGALTGILVWRRWGRPAPRLALTRPWAVATAMVALATCVTVFTLAGDPPNPRGLSAPGALEGWWTFDEESGSKAMDASGNGLTGTLRGRPQRVSGVHGRAIHLTERRQSVRLGTPGALRLQGSMTVCAWMRASSFPWDDAAIISSLDEFGYQLDTTIDRGPRTIGFKLIDPRGELAARYGATPLRTNTWYHLAGTYNAATRRLDVFLNGEPDNGPQVGTLAGPQRSSRAPTYIGRRSGSTKFPFLGDLDDVRIYSAALSAEQLHLVMQGRSIDVADAPSERETAWLRPDADADTSAANAGFVSDPEDTLLPAAAALLGTLIAVACCGFWPGKPTVPALACSLLAGSLVWSSAKTHLPAFNMILLPLVALAGAAAVLAAATGKDS